MEEAAARQLPKQPVEGFEAVHGRGVRAELAGRACHGNLFALALEFGNFPLFILGQDLRHDLADAQLPADSVRRAAVVAGEHDDINAQAAWTKPVP